MINYACQHGWSYESWIIYTSTRVAKLKCFPTYVGRWCLNCEGGFLHSHNVCPRLSIRGFQTLRSPQDHWKGVYESFMFCCTAGKCTSCGCMYTEGSVNREDNGSQLTSGYPSCNMTPEVIEWTHLAILYTPHSVLFPDEFTHVTMTPGVRLLPTIGHCTCDLFTGKVWLFSLK